MSPRNRVLLVLFLVLLAAALVRTRPWQGDLHERTARRVQRLFPELGARRDEVARVRIESEGRVTTLRRAGTAWVVEEKLDHPADGGRLADLIDSMALLDDRDVVAANPDKHSVYKVAEGQGTRVQVLALDGSRLADLVVGGLRSQDVRQGGGVLLEFYLRRADRPEVVLARDFHLPLTDPADWIDGRLLPGLEARQLDWIEREDHLTGQDWRLERAAERPTGGEEAAAGVEERPWRMVRPEQRPARQFAGDSFCFTFTGLRAADVVARLEAGATPGDPSWGFSSDVFRAGSGQRRFVLHLGAAADGGGRYAWLEGRDWVYLLEGFEVGQLRQGVADMLPPREEAAAPGRGADEGQ